MKSNELLLLMLKNETSMAVAVNFGSDKIVYVQLLVKYMLYKEKEYVNNKCRAMWTNVLYALL